MGNITLLNAKNTIGIIGSRDCTEYGRKVSYHFSKELSAEGLCIVSGMALGIDGMAHQAAIDHKGKTIAVLGGGFNHPYPKENEWLIHKLLENGGCLLTEYAPEIEPDIKKFPKRNRIISALSDSLLVVEAAYRSGSSITVKYAKEQGKKVYAIPSNIDSSKGIGTNRFIQEGATLVVKPQEILEDSYKKELKKYQKEKIDTIEKTKSREQIQENRENQQKEIELFMKPEYMPIYNQLLEEPMHVNEIAKKANKTVQEVTVILSLMEIEGYVIQTQNNYFVKLK